MRYAKGIMWLDDCRIPFTKEDKENINFDRPRLRNKQGTDWILSQAMDYTDPSHKEYNQQGRFTPNLLVCDDMLNDGVIYKAGKKQGQNYPSQDKNYSVNIGGGIHTSNNTYNDKGSNSRYYDLDKWFDKMMEKL